MLGTSSIPEATALSGILVIDKDAGVTSFDVVRFIKRLLRPTKIGHGGTLDPLATGVLPVFLGWATHLAAYSLAGSKLYRATIHLGVTTDTYDAAGTVTALGDPSAIS